MKYLNKNEIKTATLILIKKHENIKKIFLTSVKLLQVHF